MTHSIQIIGLSRVTQQKPNRGGAVILAFFDAEVNGFELRGCALTRTSGGGLVAWPPNLIDENAQRCIRIANDSLRHSLMLEAREAYRALGGTDAELIGTSVAMGPRRA